MREPAYIRYLERVALAALADRPDFDEVYDEQDYFIVLNIRECIRRHRQERGETDQPEPTSRREETTPDA